MRKQGSGRWLWFGLAVLILLVAALFFFEWLGSEQPQKTVEIEVQPGVNSKAAAAGDGKSAND